MPPSPALRCSPGRDTHKRGRSLEGRTFKKEKDDDLTLFNDMDIKEKDNFLLQSDDDFEDILSSKFRYFSSNNIGVSFPARGESSDLLNAEGEKNDYDWLITPPDTPLFRSLDDETPVVTLAQRGRSRSKPITISRSSTMEKSHISSRGSASPNRLSISPRSGNSTIISNGRPSSAHRSSPTPSSRGTTPPRGPSPPPRKPSTPVPRSSTPPSRRMSGGENTSSFGKRGASPINKTQGNSASPKVKAWQTNIPGFPSEAPPNLRTSLGDRPASYVRGSSPASRNGRQSMSPTASRSARSSHSHDRDLFSSRSKGSIASSGDDDADSLQSNPVNSSDHSASRKYTSNHSPSLSRKSTRPGLSSSAPKRSFESALRQMENQRKGPQNMFRPLLSSVPSSTFYVGKTTSVHHSLISRNSSITSSSNASSNPNPLGAHDAEESDHNHHDIATTSGKAPYTDAEDDIFTLEKTDSIGVDCSSVDINGGAKIAFQIDVPQNIDPPSSPSASVATPEILDSKSKYLNVNESIKDRAMCAECGRIYLPIEFTEGELNICPDCRRPDGVLNTTCPVPAVMIPELSRNLSMKNSDEHTSFDAEEPSVLVSGFSGPTDVSLMSSFQSDDNVDKNHIPSGDLSLNLSAHNTGGQKVSEEQVIEEPAAGHKSSSDGDYRIQNIQHSSEIPKLKLDRSEGTGISILLRRSSSVKGPYVQSRSFTATSISFDELSYARDFTPSIRSSSSSLDISTKHRRSGSSVSGMSSQTYQGLSINNNEIVVNDDNEAGNENVLLEEQSLVPESTRVNDEFTQVVCNDHVEKVTADTTNAIDSAESSALSITNIDDSGSYVNGEEFQNDTGSILNGEDSLVSCDSEVVDLTEIPTHSLLETISEIEIENGHPGSLDSHSDFGSSESSDFLNELQEPLASTGSDKDVAAVVAECGFSDQAPENFEESTVTVEVGNKAKRLTLEEATDAILFCSSIVHNLAYEAAAIAMENEKSVPLEDSRPLVTILGNSNPDNRKEPHGRTMAKRTQKSHKTRKRDSKESDTETKPEPLSGNDVGTGTVGNSTARIVGIPDRGDSMYPPKLESKCNCTIM